MELFVEFVRRVCFPRRFRIDYSSKFPNCTGMWWELCRTLRELNRARAISTGYSANTFTARQIIAMQLVLSLNDDDLGHDCTPKDTQKSSKLGLHCNQSIEFFHSHPLDGYICCRWSFNFLSSLKYVGYFQNPFEISWQSRQNYFSDVTQSYHRLWLSDYRSKIRCKNLSMADDYRKK